jgi:5'-3' exoribonuclease 1
MEYFIRMKMNEKAWGDISVIYSSEKVPGEGEHKLVSYVRNQCSKEDHYMMQGMDADLIMLSLATHFPNFHILRENPYRYEHEYYYINMKNIRENLVNVLLTEQGTVEDRLYINDFITMIFLTGNDFLPHLPTIEILEGGVENLFETYRSVVKQYGTMINSVDRIHYESLKIFLGTLSDVQVPFLQEKRSKSINYPDRLLEKHTKLENDGKFSLNWDAYRKEYYAKKMGCKSEKQITEACMKYIDGLQWVFTYYTKGVSDWKWHYPYNYAPFLSDLTKTLEKMIEMDKKRLVKKHKKEEEDRKKEIFSGDKPYYPFMQLLCVLPKQSKELLPQPLAQLMASDSMASFYPDMIEIDMDGKHNDWEGVVLLPPIDFSILEKEYVKMIKAIEPRDRSRNIHGKSFIYTYDDTSDVTYKSYYGEINNCKVRSEMIEL